MEKFSSPWWHILPMRASKEPTGENNAQLVPGSYESSKTTGNESLEDYRRIVSSIGLRGLKDKTQVFPLDQEHHVRTRLSHSFEVATTASSILEEILSRHTITPNNAKASRDQSEKSIGRRIGNEQDITSLRYSLMAACLLHDVGNPPFGHFGEKVIGSWFVENEARYCCTDSDGTETRDASDENLNERIWCKGYNDLKHFEGNANSLRIALSPSCMYDGRRLNLSATTLFSVVKYPWLLNSEQAAHNKNKYNLFLSDMERLSNFEKQIDSQQSSFEEKLAISITAGDRHPLSFILEASDDISYVTADFEDAFRKGLFSVSDVVCLYAKEESPSPFTDTLVDLLVTLAGSEDDVQLFTCFNLNEKSFLKGAQACTFLDEQRNTFREALQQNEFVQQSAHQSRQLQEIYISRWVDIVRGWLRFTAAGSIAKSNIFCGSREEIRKCHDIDAALFGNHVETVKFLKKVMNRHVYNSPGNAKLNLTANTILKDILDRFIPAAIHCTNPVDVNSDENNHMTEFEKTLIFSIPLCFRLDYQERKSLGDSWDEPRDRYEKVMMALDYITSMTDGFAMQLHREIC